MDALPALAMLETRIPGDGALGTAVGCVLYEKWAMNGGPVAVRRRCATLSPTPGVAACCVCSVFSALVRRQTGSTDCVQGGNTWGETVWIHTLPICCCVCCFLFVFFRFVCVCVACVIMPLPLQCEQLPLGTYAHTHTHTHSHHCHMLCSWRLFVVVWFGFAVFLWACL